MYSTFIVCSPTECVMGLGDRATAGPVNDARCVYDVEALWGGRVQVKTEPGSVSLGPVTMKHTPPLLPPCARTSAMTKTKTTKSVRHFWIHYIKLKEIKYASYFVFLINISLPKKQKIFSVITMWLFPRSLYCASWFICLTENNHYVRTDLPVYFYSKSSCLWCR